MRRLLRAAAVATIVSLGVAGPASAGNDVATVIDVQSATVTVNGTMVHVPVKVTDANGKPVPRVLLRLIVPVQFMGADKNEIVGEATTNDAGKAELEFSPAQTGTVDASVAFWGASGYLPSDASVTFDVQRAVVTYTQAPVGLQAWWARSYVILIPFVFVWLTYLVVLTLVVRIKRAGGRVGPPETAPSS